MSDKELTDKQEAFCREYMVDFNATQAAIRTGYSKRTAQVQGSRLLSNVMVKKRVDELRAKAITRNNLDVDQVIAMLLEDRAEAAALKQMGPKVRAGELIGRTIGAFVDRIEEPHKQTPEQVVDEFDAGPIAKAIAAHMLSGFPCDDDTMRQVIAAALGQGGREH